jgi:transcriptional regulator with XRE-family HTH domain
VTKVAYTNKTLLSEKLEQLRAESGLSYQHLSERCYVDVAYLHRLESGRASRPSRDVLIKIGVGLGLDIESLDDLIKLAGHWPLLRGQPAELS